jgi:hypothetical protein
MVSSSSALFGGGNGSGGCGAGAEAAAATKAATPSAFITRGGQRERHSEAHRCSDSLGTLNLG